MKRIGGLVGAVVVTLAGVATAAPGDRAIRLVTDVAATNATFRGASADGSRVWFETTSAIAGTGDGDAAQDVYERRSDGSVRPTHSSSERPPRVRGCGSRRPKRSPGTATATPPTTCTNVSMTA